MNSPRFPIKALLFLVGLAALDFSVIRAMDDSAKAHTATYFTQRLFFNVLPLANFLVIKKIFNRNPTADEPRRLDWVGPLTLLLWILVAPNALGTAKK